MKNLLYALSFLLIGMGGGLVLKEVLIQYPYIGYWILGAGALLLVSLIISEPLKKGHDKIWGGRNKEWWATSSYQDGAATADADPLRSLSKDRRERWRSPKPQELDAWFQVDMAKERMISNIEFEADDSGIEQPRGWRIMFYGSGHKTLGHKDGQGCIYAKGSHIPNRIQYFKVQIKKVAEDMPEGSNYAKWYGAKVFWTISLIRLREYRFSLFGKRFWTHEL